MGHQQLIDDLRAAGFDAVLTHSGGAEFVSFAYSVPIGALAGQEVRIHLQAPDWPLNPPSGPHVSPRIPHPGDTAHHQSPVGQDAIYWSRPHPRWAQSDRSIEEYLTHLRTLFSQFAEPAA
jgi:hypothetical protein